MSTENSSVTTLLWDLDGTLVDSEPVHDIAVSSACDSLGVKLPDDIHEQLLGSTSSQTHAILTGLGLQMPLDEWVAYKHEFYIAHSHLLKAHPGIPELLSRARQQQVAMAVVSNSRRVEVDLNLEKTGLTDYFNIVLTLNDVSKGKPEPEGYLRAAEALGVTPDLCVVVEDSVTGATAGLNAGMTTLYHPEKAEYLPACPAGAIALGPAASLENELESLGVLAR